MKFLESPGLTPARNGINKTPSNIGRYYRAVAKLANVAPVLWLIKKFDGSGYPYGLKESRSHGRPGPGGGGCYVAITDERLSARSHEEALAELVNIAAHNSIRGCGRVPAIRGDEAGICPITNCRLNTRRNSITEQNYLEIAQNI